MWPASATASPSVDARASAPASNTAPSPIEPLVAPPRAVASPPPLGAPPAPGALPAVPPECRAGSLVLLEHAARAIDNNNERPAGTIRVWPINEYARATSALIIVRVEKLDR